MRIFNTLLKLPKQALTFGPLTARRARGHSFILMYHRILPEEECAAAEANHALNVSDRHFDAHLNFLKVRFDILSLTQLVNAFEQKSIEPGRPKLAITFDDGWRDNYDYAWPILKKHGIPATIFLVSDYIGGKKPLWWHALEKHYKATAPSSIETWVFRLVTIAEEAQTPGVIAKLKGAKASTSKTPEEIIQLFKEIEYGQIEDFSQALFLNECPSESPDLIAWEHAREMQESGIQFGAHTRRHELLTYIDAASIRATVSGSVEACRSEGINTIPIFSYPNGYTDERVQSAVADTGFKYAVGTNAGTITKSGANPLELPRINIGGGNNADVRLLSRRLARAVWLPQ